MRKLVILFVLGFLSQQGATQSRFTLNGYIKDSLSGEFIIGATVAVNGQSKGVTSNQYGFYSITLDAGRYELVISHVSYIGSSVIIDLDSNRSLNVDLMSRSALIG